MSDVIADVNARHENPFYTLRPKPQRTALFLRAALAEDFRGGPWLTLQRITSESGVRLYRHHIHLSDPSPDTDSMVTMLTGNDVLALAVRNRWPVRTLVDPDIEQLRVLGTQAVMMRDIPRWDEDFPAWCADREKNQPAHADTADRHRAAARALRWQVAELWLRTK